MLRCLSGPRDGFGSIQRLRGVQSVFVDKGRAGVEATAVQALINTTHAVS